MIMSLPGRRSSTDCRRVGWIASLLLCLISPACNRVLGIEPPGAERDGAVDLTPALIDDDAQPPEGGASDDGTPDAGPADDATPGTTETGENAPDGDGSDGDTPEDRPSGDGPSDDGAGPDSAAPTDGAAPPDSPCDLDEVGPGRPDTSPPDAGPPLAISTASLPAPLYNVAYNVSLTAEGGTGSARVWSVTRGALPQGLDLETNGVLHGSAQQDGTFEFDITVAEAEGAARTTRTFALTIVHKRWLVFQADDELMGSYQLYAVDTGNLNARVKVSSNIPSSTGTVESLKFGFSPDGRYLAYVGAVVGTQQLYVVDMSGELPGAPRKVSEFGPVRDFAWSPDSLSLAFVAVTDPAGNTYAVLVADPTSGAARPQRISDTAGFVQYGIDFVADDLLTYWINTLAYTRRTTGDVFDAPRSLTSIGLMTQRWPDLHSALFASLNEDCRDPTWTWTLIDFRDPFISRELSGFVSVAQDRRHLAHRDSVDLVYRIFGTWNTEPIAEFPTASRYCAPGSWSHDGNLFAAGGDDSKVQVTRIDQQGAAVVTPLVGDYGSPAPGFPPVFSPDDRWLGISTDLGAYVARNEGGTLEEPFGEGVAPSKSFGQPRVSFSPDSTYLATAESDSEGRAVRVTAIDLTQNPLKVSRLSVGAPQGGSAVFAIGWSVHSTELALIVRDAPFPSPTNLYVFPRAKLLPDAPVNSNVTGYSSVEQVIAFQFQP